MSRRKRLSGILEKAELRATSMVSIEPELDLGNGRTLEMYWEAINGLRAKQQKYNTLLSSVDNLYNEMLAEERALGEMSEHMLSGVKVKFGRDSYEYEMAGGVRRSERKRPQRKTVTMG
ncbi:hypothetical protein IQ265_02775 [Nodosilinea sp. LEGE 06152]|uniref:hypothetical protein n=1 Tax=Nodosilinea sp. LEGE 06152 TaxID=2777966 RepID=UPI0018826D1A|nr:hypothetical protein [Nodosilinea sp. LEGE 06152]MBE9155759.1 hypothetical protein [Nodosilinea sp. LEGE 06152]